MNTGFVDDAILEGIAFSRSTFPVDSPPPKGERGGSDRDRKRMPALALLAVALAAVAMGCDRDVHLFGHDLRNVTVKTATHYGITLDQAATPEQVAYVLLRAIRDDVLAEDPSARAVAVGRQLEVCAANRIATIYPAQIDPAETLKEAVRRWAPTVADYVRDIDTDWDKAAERFRLLGPQPAANIPGGGQECQVVMELADPSGDPQASVLLVIGLVQDEGYWRVLQVGFSPTRRSLEKRPATATETTPKTK